MPSFRILILSDHPLKTFVFETIYHLPKSMFDFYLSLSFLGTFILMFCTYFCFVQDLLIFVLPTYMLYCF